MVGMPLKSGHLINYEATMHYVVCDFPQGKINMVLDLVGQERSHLQVSLTTMER